MPSAFHGIGMMNTALRAFQRALDVTGHNITNVNTPGFSRQSAELSEMPPDLFREGVTHMVGNGVTLASINRIRDNFLAARQMEASSEGGRLDSLTGGLDGIQSVILEPGGASVNDALTNFFNSWSALGSNPGDFSLRQQVQQAGLSLASRVRSQYLQIQSHADQANTEAADAIGNIQQLVNEIADLNQQIRGNAITGAEPNDLLDMRDQKLQDLSALVDVRVQRLPDGSASVYLNQLTLVDQSGARTIPTGFDAASSTLTDGTNSYPIRSGKLAGLFQVVQAATRYQAQLDAFANSLRTQFNSIHTTGTTGLGTTNQLFFNDANPQTGAVDFDLDPAVKADPEAIAAGVTGNPGDGGLALSMSALRDTQIAGLGNRTFGGYFRDVVSGIGQDASFATALKGTQAALSEQVAQQVQSVSGVSLDDEMSNMLRYQRSYQAAAKALSIFDQTTEDLINMIR